MRARKSLASQAQEEAEVVAGGGEDKRLSRVVARDREVVQVPLSTLYTHAAVFAMGSCNRLRSSILIAWSVARPAEPTFQRAGDPIPRTVAVSCPAFNTPGWPVMRWSGSSTLSAPMFQGALRDTGFGARAERLSPARLRPSPVHHF